MAEALPFQLPVRLETGGSTASHVLIDDDAELICTLDAATHDEALATERLINRPTGLDQAQIRRLRAAVTRLVRVSITESWKGSGRPADALLIERDLVQAKQNYERVLRDLAKGI